MSKGFFNVPIPSCEPVKSYTPGSEELNEVLDQYRNMYNNTIDIPMYIGDKQVFTNDKRNISPPHDHNHVVGTFNYGGKKEVSDNRKSALKAREKWSNMSWEHRASIFLKAADLLVKDLSE